MGGRCTATPRHAIDACALRPARVWPVRSCADHRAARRYAQVETPVDLQMCRSIKDGAMYCGWTMSPALGTVDFGNGVTVASNDTAVGIVKFDTDGKAEWASAAVMGSLLGALAFDASLDGSVLAVVTQNSVVRIGTSGMQTGAVLWEQPNPIPSQGMVVTDDNQEVYVAGVVTGTGPLLLNDTSGNAVVVRSRGSYDLVMLNYDATYGTPTWATGGGGPDLDYFVGSIAKDSDTHGIFFGGYTRCARCQHGGSLAPPPLGVHCPRSLWPSSCLA